MPMSRTPHLRKARPEDARRINLALVLQTVYNDPELSRADIARATGLTRVTVSDLVAELIGSDLVWEAGLSSVSRPGKPATLLGFNATARDILSLDLSAPDTLIGAIVSLRGVPQRVIRRSLSGSVGEGAVDAVIAFARELAGASSRPILGLGVGTPGTVDETGNVLSAPNLEWRNVPLQRLLSDELGLAVHVENDANAAVLAERRFGAGSDDLVRIHLSRGVGAGLLVAGDLVHGASRAAGEIGHVVIDDQGPACSCGKRGCLETWVSLPALTAKIAARPAAREQILTEAGQRLGSALSPVVGMLGLRDIVIGGPADFVDGPLLQATRDTIHDRTRSEFSAAPSLRASALGEDAVILGAAALVLLHTLGVS